MPGLAGRLSRSVEICCLAPSSTFPRRAASVTYNYIYVRKCDSCVLVYVSVRLPASPDPLMV